MKDAKNYIPGLGSQFKIQKNDIDGLSENESVSKE